MVAAVAVVTDDADGDDDDDDVAAVDGAAGAPCDGVDVARDVLQVLLHPPSYCNCSS